MISKTTPNQECMYDFNFFFAFRVGTTPILYRHDGGDCKIKVNIFSKSFFFCITIKQQIFKKEEKY